MCITRKSDKDVLNFQICEYLFIKSQFKFLSETDKIDIDANDNKSFVFKLDI